MKTGQNNNETTLGNSITILLLGILVIFNYFVLNQKSYELVGIMLVNYAINDLYKYKASRNKCDLIAGIALVIMSAIFIFFFVIDMLSKIRH
ncbi:MAG: hypothetical protein HFJ09_16485 [Lachnospiraceae bacterium]|nr:hypothetical protein [Lachnospiraceae bacterium]